MPLDHYVSQVHLKNFYSPKLGELMYAVRKSDLHRFPPNAGSVCRIENGSTNSYLREDRIIEEFLKDIEPNYNRSVEKLRANEIENDCIYTIAGFVSYVLTCSPCGIRINKKPLTSMIEETAISLEERGKLTPLPPELGAGSMKDLIESGQLKVEVDPKYPQAIGISDIISLLTFLANSTWEILINNHQYSPFFTSDFPVALEQTRDPLIFNRIIPLTPNTALRILPNRMLEDEKPDYTFSNFKHSIKKVTRKEVNHINTLIVRCAENLVFFRDDFDWVFQFIKKNSKYCIEPKVFEVPGPNGKYTFFTSRVVEK